MNRPYGLLGALLLATLVSCTRTVDVPAPSQEPPAQVQSLSVDSHLKALYDRFDPAHPGRGVTDYPGHTVEDVPKSYAKVLLAELDRQQIDLMADWPDLGTTVGFWLLRHADENNDGVTGWGVPVAWDAYGDGSVNPKHTEYTISTAIAVHALLDWAEKGAGAPRTEILSTVSRAMKPYLSRQMLSPSGMLPYSLLEQDRRYDTFNPAAYLAGQMQRYSRIVGDKRVAGKLRDVADMTMQVLLDQHKLSSEGGAWYWNYSIQESTPNDLPHASYIVDGIATYVRYGGRLAGEFDMARIYAHLAEFLPEKGTGIRGWPRFRPDIDRPARSYDLGMALYLACHTPELSPLRQRLKDAVADYRNGDGAYLKYPPNTKDAEPMAVAEYEAYLYRGLTHCALADEAEKGLLPLAIRIGKRETVSHKNPPQFYSRGEFQTVPGVSFGAGMSHVRSEFQPSERKSAIGLGSHNRRQFQEPGIPVWVQQEGSEHLTVFFRSIPQGRLSLRRIATSHGSTSISEIARISDGELMFRAARWHEGQLYAVIYDNPGQANYLLRFVPGDSGYQQRGDAIKLPTLEDPAGRTYEMIPAVYFAAHDKRLYLFGGTLKAEILPEGQIQEHRIDNCLRMLEVSETPAGPAVLCLAKVPANPLSPFLISAPSGLAVPEIAPGKVPWNLHTANGVLKIMHAAKAADFAALFAFDLARAQQSGWMEFGIDNTEGRIPWSQIYYLNGFMDILLLARQDPVFRSQMEPVLSLVRRRLDMEIQLIDQVWRENRYVTRAFTVDRSSALFAVQTSRLLLLMDRYRQEVPNPLPLSSYNDLQHKVLNLRGHIEVLARAGESEQWIASGKPHLRWPKGSKFYYDGTPVPYNHQNEWAYSVLMNSVGNQERSDATKNTAVEIIRFFLDRNSLNGELPREGRWNYWWGVARDGWKAADGVSENKPEYAGDKIDAWISFRSIDTMASLSASPYLQSEQKAKLLSSASSLVSRGLLYPFVSYELMKREGVVRLRRDVALQYIRVSSPWEMQNAAWAYLYFAHAGDGDIR